MAMLRRDFMQPAAADALADAAGMSVSVFHRHFRAMTTFVALQFPGEAVAPDSRPPPDAGGRDEHCLCGRRGGYISASQFTREYARPCWCAAGPRDRRRKMSAA